jgi:hypothetical protein
MKGDHKTSSVNPPLSEPLLFLRTAPNELDTYLRDAYYEKKDSLDPIANVDVSWMQARLYMDPKIMTDPNLITTINHMRFKRKLPEIYYQELNRTLKNEMSNWLKEGMPNKEDAFDPSTLKLKKFTDFVYQGSTEKNEAPKAPAPSLEEQFVRLLVNSKNEQATRLLEEHTTILSKAHFTLPHNIYSHGSANTIDLISLLSQYSSDSLIKIAFEKGILKGGEIAYHYYLSMNAWNKSDFIMTTGHANTEQSIQILNQYFIKNAKDPHDILSCINELNSLKDAKRTVEIVKKFFADKEDAPQLNITILLKTINDFDNDEELIKTSSPLFKVVGPYDFWGYQNVLSFVKSIPKQRRQDIVTNISSYLTSDIIERIDSSAPIDDLMKKIYSIHKHGLERSALIWRYLKAIANTYYSKDRKFDENFLEHIDNLLKCDTNTLKAFDIELVESSDKRENVSFDSREIQTTLEEHAINFVQTFTGSIWIQILCNTLRDGYVPKDNPDLLKDSQDFDDHGIAQLVANYLLKRLTNNS